ncbi:type II toxin-antitoxin system VapC family toxin [Candidatus Saccharibacteria bacterium]|nr:type II toxin-antitoxin system VapC family toxin [Candidatus Saccharibacteria bacterium]
MNKPASVFLDANVLIYFLDETARQHTVTISNLQNLVDKQAQLYTSHHVIEEVLFIVSKLASSKAVVTVAIKQIAKLPGLLLVEPATDLQFALRYVELWQKTSLGINDALLLQLIIDGSIGQIFSFDAALLRQAKKFGIQAA